MSAAGIDVAAAYHRGDWETAVTAIGPALEEGVPQNDLNLLLAIYCTSLFALGRRGDAAAAYTRHRKKLSPKVDTEALTMRGMAAAAADHPDLTRILSLWYPNSPFSMSRTVTMPVTRLSKWCTERNVPYVTVDPAQVNADGEEITPYAFATIAGAEILGGWDFVITSNGELLGDSGYSPLGRLTGQTNPHIYVKKIELAALAWPESATDFDSDALFLSAPDEFHVGHFIVDFLPRLRCLGTLHADVKILLPSEAPKKFRDLLHCFGVAEDRIISCDLGKRYRFRSLTVTQVSVANKPNPNNIKFLRDTFAPDMPKKPEFPGYFFDRGNGTRQIVNRAEVNDVLAEFGIAHIDLAALTVAQQREALASAKVLIGTYGSDLLACLFAPNGSHAIELIVDHRDATAEWCRRCGLEHEYLVCEGAVRPGQAKVKKDRDLIVDCDELRRRLSAVFARQDLT